MSQNEWHYSRPELAKKYLALFDLGLTSARGLFARRRMGKTEFLKKDFIPAAESAGYIVVYTNLWELEIDPATALISEFYKKIEPKGFAKLWTNLNLLNYWVMILLRPWWKELIKFQDFRYRLMKLLKSLKS